jgi:hypothetical protein
MADWKMKGQYLKNCNCLASCPCDTIGVPAPHPFCEGVAGMQIETGYFETVDLSGLRWVATFHFPGALHEGNGSQEVFIDARASEEQRHALLTILSGQAGGPFFEILSQVVSTVHGPYFVDIGWEFDKAKRRATVTVDNFFETVSVPLGVPASGQEQQVIVRMPGGFEYKEMEVAQTAVLKGSGQITFDWRGTHSSLAEVEHTPAGLVG